MQKEYVRARGQETCKKCMVRLEKLRDRQAVRSCGRVERGPARADASVHFVGFDSFVTSRATSTNALSAGETWARLGK
jgi:hypothetical protein